MESSFDTVVTRRAALAFVAIAASLSMACALRGDDDGSTDPSGEAEPSTNAESADGVSPVGFESVDPASTEASFSFVIGGWANRRTSETRRPLGRGGKIS